MNIVIRGTGSALPERRLTNRDLEKLVETSDEWIVARTGISERRMVASDEATSDLAIRAAHGALEMAQIEAEELDLIVVATLTPDTLTPSTANLVHRSLLRGRSIPSFDLNAACSGFVYGLEVVSSLMKAGLYRRVLLVGAEAMTRFMDYEDRGVCILFGDAAGAVVLEATEDAGGILVTRLASDGQFADLIEIPGGGSRRPPSQYMLAQRQPYVRMNGQQVFKVAVQSMEQVARDTLAQVGWELDDVDHVITHQANRRILDAVADRLGVEEARMPLNVNKCGNTSAASIPVLLDECNREDRFERGDKLLLIAFGGGLTWGAAALEWS
ncbi:MAG: ketoacyl-ACP synthase III [bacterium]|nr:ketoacyl-ACP synthase III [bacterium]